MQEAYASILEQRRRNPVPPRQAPPPPSDPDLERRLADLERELGEKARAARERAKRAAREAAAATRPGRPSDEELGYVKTDDSLGQILADARKEFSERLSHVGEEPKVRDRVADLLDDVADALRGDRAKKKDSG